MTLISKLWDQNKEIDLKFDFKKILFVYLKHLMLKICTHIVYIIRFLKHLFSIHLYMDVPLGASTVYCVNELVIFNQPSFTVITIACLLLLLVLSLQLFILHMFTLIFFYFCSYSISLSTDYYLSLFFCPSSLL